MLEYPFYSYAALEWGRHFQEFPGNDMLALKFLQSGRVLPLWPDSIHARIPKTKRVGSGTYCCLFQSRPYHATAPRN
ncbi:hypothetical protein BJX64DRAFT_252386 [Aspergillus heterothallicus]